MAAWGEARPATLAAAAPTAILRPQLPAATTRTPAAVAAAMAAPEVSAAIHGVRICHPAEKVAPRFRRRLTGSPWVEGAAPALAIIPTAIPRPAAAPPAAA